MNNKRRKLLSIILCAEIVASVFPGSGTGATSDSIAFYNSKKSILEMESYDEAYDTNHDGIVNVFDVIRENKEVFQEESYTDLKAQIHSLETQIELLTQKLADKEDKSQVELDLSEINSALSVKVDQQDGKQLSSNDYTDEDKSKLALLENYNDTEIKKEIEGLDSELSKTNELLSEKVNKEDGKQLSSNDFSDEYKEKLDSLKNYDDTEIKNEIDNQNALIDSLVNAAIDEKNKYNNLISDIENSKVDKEDGKQLSSNDFTDEEKKKLENISNYDDTEIKNEIKDIKNNLNQLESKGILPTELYTESPLIDKLNIFSKLKNKDGRVTIIQLGDSISTNNNYASPLEDAAYRAPRMEEMNLPYYIEELIRWKGQEYRRSDAMVDKSNTVPMFTEVCDTAQTKYYDDAWDWQLSNQSENFFKMWTRVLDGNDCSVTFTIPSGTKEVGFIYRTDYLCADNCTVSVSNGDGKVRARLFNDSDLEEANGFLFSMQENDEVFTATYQDYTGEYHYDAYRISKSQRRLILWVDDTSEDIVITITANGTGRLNYWGVEYSSTPMLRYINVARGGHNIERLRTFESYDVDYFKPDCILMQCMVINEGAMSIANINNKYSAFTERFTTYINDLNSKSYSPEVIPYVLYIGTQANIVDQKTGKYQMSWIGNDYYDTYRYISKLETAVKEINDGIFLNFFNDFDRIAYKLADYGDGNVFTSAIKGSGATGNTFTNDDVHLNDFGSLVAYRLIKPYLNY